MDTETLSNAVVMQANRDVYNLKTAESYDQNESIFSPAQTVRLTGIIERMQRESGGQRLLDVGCGTGNLLRIARGVFPFCAGVDAAEKLLARARDCYGLANLSAGSADSLPFADNSFDAVTLYAVLHHLYDPQPALAEAYRVLKPGGILFTDHDPNRAFGQLYRPLSKVLFKNRQSFGTELEDLAEYHHTRGPGLNAKGLRRALLDVGFSSATAKLRQSTNGGLQGYEAFALRLLKLGSRVVRLPCLFTHFSLWAIK